MSVISCTNLRFSRQHTEVLHGINFEIKEGGIVGLLGKNGAGKSTTINLLMGFLEPDSGSCKILGEESYALTPKVRERVGLLHEGFTQYNFMTISEVEEYYRHFYPKWDDSLFWNLVNRMQIPSTRKIARLSCGQRSQVTLGLILAQRAELLILDDFSLGLDVGYRRLFLEFLRDYVDTYHATVLLTSHVVNELEDFLDHVIVIQKGSVLCNCTKNEFLRTYHAYKLSNNWVGCNWRKVKEIINIECGVKDKTVVTTMTLDEMKDFVKSQGVCPKKANQIVESPMSFEDTFVGITGRY